MSYVCLHRLTSCGTSVVIQLATFFHSQPENTSFTILSVFTVTGLSACMPMHASSVLRCPVQACSHSLPKTLVCCLLPAHGFLSLTIMVMAGPCRASSCMSKDIIARPQSLCSSPAVLQCKQGGDCAGWSSQGICSRGLWHGQVCQTACGCFRYVRCCPLSMCWS